MVNYPADDVASLVISTYTNLKFRPPDGQFTILAAFVLRDGEDIKVISLGTGSKCLPAARLPQNGDALHDSHAEVLARRGAIRWLLEEISRSCDMQTRWIWKGQDGKYALKADVKLDMYISTLPCGDASTRYLASSQDAEMAALKDSTPFPELPPGTASRGRDNYSLYGVLRTKPGRADSPPTLSMSCSDKIAAWNVLGIQGALASRLLRPVYIDRVIVGEVAQPMRQVVLEDCQRALHARLRSIAGLPAPFQPNVPVIEFTSVSYSHSRSALGPSVSNGCNDSLCYIADSTRASEVLINGVRRGISPKHRHNPNFRPVLSKLVLYGLFKEVAAKLDMSLVLKHTYFEAKQCDAGYSAARAILKGSGGPFEGWVTSGREWEEFTSQKPLPS
ncbi:hypothetical protein GSI_00553 [Ganoderma sinense ZZ0214-1]|uniref:A to I editase domain-containing protein n=1 Tax=Ganoderma sinense ZZ0214-1 TaxID=1077348 RepID=A0A2G8ST27_9APHY|nr:hypothetical protein GSI_00553 [Ganoderma sinense ZZ0214-1]